MFIAFRFIPIAPLAAEWTGSGAAGAPGPQLGAMTNSVVAELADVLAVDASRQP